MLCRSLSAWKTQKQTAQSLVTPWNSIATRAFPAPSDIIMLHSNGPSLHPFSETVKSSMIFKHFSILERADSMIINFCYLV